MTAPLRSWSIFVGATLALATGSLASSTLVACGDEAGTTADGGDGSVVGAGDGAPTDDANLSSDGSTPGDGEASDAAISEGGADLGDGGGDGALGSDANGTQLGDAATDGDVFVPCHNLAQRGSVIQETASATALPSFDPPGTIARGDYKLTAVTVHTGVGGATGPTGLTRQETLAIDPPSAISVSMLSVATETPSGGSPTTTYETRRLSFQADGGASVSELCAANFVGRTLYQSTGRDAGAEFRIVLPPGSGRVLTYTKD